MGLSLRIRKQDETQKTVASGRSDFHDAAEDCAVSKIGFDLSHASKVESVRAEMRANASSCPETEWSV